VESWDRRKYTCKVSKSVKEKENGERMKKENNIYLCGTLRCIWWGHRKGGNISKSRKEEEKVERMKEEKNIYLCGTLLCIRWDPG